MSRVKRRHDPAIYGELRAKFLDNLDGIPEVTDEDEERRQELMDDIREGRIRRIE